jgi:hypothetical protein
MVTELKRTFSKEEVQDPRWGLEGWSRQQVLHKSKIMMRCWSHTWQKKTTKKKQISETSHPQPAQSFSTPHYTENPGELPCHQTLAPNLLGKPRPTGEQISGMWYSHSHPWNKPAEPPRQTDPCPTKINK